MDGWNTILSYWVSAYFQGRTVIFREGNGLSRMTYDIRGVIEWWTFVGWPCYAGTWQENTSWGNRVDGRNPAPAHYLRVLYIPAGTWFVPSTVSPTELYIQRTSKNCCDRSHFTADVGNPPIAIVCFLSMRRRYDAPDPKLVVKPYSWKKSGEPFGDV